jgi:hypothetical protein
MRRPSWTVMRWFSSTAGSAALGPVVPMSRARSTRRRAQMMSLARRMARSKRSSSNG